MRSLHQDRRPADDVDRALFFHLGNFSSVKEELELIESLLGMVDNCSSTKTIELAMRQKEEDSGADRQGGRERAL